MFLMDEAKHLETRLIDEDGLFQLIRAADISHFRRPEGEPASEKAVRRLTEDKDDAFQMLEGKKYLEWMEADCRSMWLVDETSDQRLWVDKYKPESLSEIVGNPSLVNALLQWLQNWQSCHLRHEMIPEAPASRSKSNGDANSKKAVLLNGPPGIGKTTTALLVTKYIGDCALSSFHDDEI